MILGVTKLNESELIGVTMEGSLNIWELKQEGGFQTKQLCGHNVGLLFYSDLYQRSRVHRIAK